MTRKHDPGCKCSTTTYDYDCRCMACIEGAPFDETGDDNKDLPTLKEACEAVLLFHSGDIWDPEHAIRWLDLTGMREATTKNLCDFVRKAMGTQDAI